MLNLYVNDPFKDELKYYKYIAKRFQSCGFNHVSDSLYYILRATEYDLF